MIYADIFNQTITILNKLRREDSAAPKDTWYKTVIEDAAWYVNSKLEAKGTSAEISTYKTVLIPFNPKYKSYTQWKSEPSDYFTMSVGDYIILGTIPETVTADNITKIISKYSANVCIVKHYSELHNRFTAHVQLKVEGV